MSTDDPDETRRQISRRDRRAAGDRSAALASALMKVSSSAVAKLELDDDLREAVDRARAVTSHIARRRAERSLASDLRGADLADIEVRLANVQATGAAEPRLFKLAEEWRARLIAEGIAAAAGFPGDHDALIALIEKARRERDTGKPPGASRALFRHVFAALDAENRKTSAPDDDPGS